jgi:hypothetical protein
VPRRSKVMPSTLRCPIDQTWLPNGLPAGTPPSGVSRRTLPPS